MISTREYSAIRGNFWRIKEKYYLLDKKSSSGLYGFEGIDFIIKSSLGNIYRPAYSASLLLIYPLFMVGKPTRFAQQSLIHREALFFNNALLWVQSTILD